MSRMATKLQMWISGELEYRNFIKNMLKLFKSVLRYEHFKLLKSNLKMTQRNALIVSYFAGLALIQGRAS